MRVRRKVGVALSIAAAQSVWAQQSALDPAGPHARAIGVLGVVFTVILGLIFLAVITLALAALLRRDRAMGGDSLEKSHRPSDATERRMGVFVGAATAASVVILFILIIASIATGKATSGPSTSSGLIIELTGNQWWWGIRYANDNASQIVVTANEIHIPVGRPVLVRGNSNDVIHSFWVPSLQGKRDLIPGHITNDWIQADRAGRFRGQCAEFCGLQHAHMALWVVAEPPDQFEAWMQHQREAAVSPADAHMQRGQDVFMNSACVLCHTIRGTSAAGQAGPDLTHLGSRFTIAAGTLPNTKGYLGGWIQDPQSLKPGNHMATVPIQAEDVQPLLDYLESLQ